MDSVWIVFGAVLIALKLLGVLSFLSWWWVTLPLWLPILLAALYAGIILVTDKIHFS